ncbi:MAG: MbnP family protein [Saprospiraceae bacterium]
MTRLLYFLAIITIIGSSFISCKDDDDDTTATKGDATIFFDHKWGATLEDFTLNSKLNHPMLNQEMTFTTFKYYVSNIKLKSEDGGEWWTQPESYFLIDATSDAASTISLKDVPAGHYTEIEILYGVDSLRNVSGAQTGVLAPDLGMFWSWNSGYIMVKAEGTSPSSSTGSFAFHLGGFKGPNATLLKKTYVFNQHLEIDGVSTPKVTFVDNPARLWHGAQGLDIISNQMAPGELAKSMSGNFYNNITFKEITK